MKFKVRVLPFARKDLLTAVAWLKERSARGADRLADAFEKAVAEIVKDPQRFPLAVEDADVVVELRQYLFGTPHGRKHRIVFTIVGNEVRILHVRGPGQNRIDPSHVRYE
ncbi:MAG: type II toxin-antitoxin system RelE/ParE family toxin [Gemmataceae bacterium]|nr:type II toxin-antitoxin system RelE/ParE family toxin [Gemmataceae bacterium]